jgi:hypothetical protein
MAFLRERDGSYTGNFAGENSGLRPENTYFWNISIWNSDPKGINP